MCENIPEIHIYYQQFEKPVHFSSENEKLDATTKKITQGVWNKVDAMIQENPDLSRKDALIELVKRAKENVELLKNGITNMLLENENNGDGNGDSDNKQDQAGSEQDSE